MDIETAEKVLWEHRRIKISKYGYGFILEKHSGSQKDGTYSAMYCGKSLKFDLSTNITDPFRTKGEAIDAIMPPKEDEKAD